MTTSRFIVSSHEYVDIFYFVVQVTYKYFELNLIFVKILMPILINYMTKHPMISVIGLLLIQVKVQFEEFFQQSMQFLNPIQYLRLFL